MKKPESRKLTLNGHAGPIEAMLSIPQHSANALAVVCHPHPLYGGSMDNKVVHYTAKTLLEMGFTVLRFNFRGVGTSAGKHDNAVGEVDDAMIAVDWLRQQFPGKALLLAGFSFGAYIAARAAALTQADVLITIAPAVNLYDFSLIEVECPWLLIQGDADEVVPPEQVKAWVTQNNRLSRVIWLEGASHFFHGRLLDLSRGIKDWLVDAI